MTPVFRTHTHTYGDQLERGGPRHVCCPLTLGLEGHVGQLHRTRMQLAVHVELAAAADDKMRVLRAKVEDENARVDLAQRAGLLRGHVRRVVAGHGHSRKYATWAVHVGTHFPSPSTERQDGTERKRRGNGNAQNAPPQTTVPSAVLCCAVLLMPFVFVRFDRRSSPTFYLLAWLSKTRTT